MPQEPAVALSAARAIRSTSADLPWPIGDMQKFRICAGAVKAWSVKLLLEIFC